MTTPEEFEEAAWRLQKWAEAYPEDIFRPLTDLDRKEHPGLITRASAGMGRHMSPFMLKWANLLTQAAAMVRAHKIRPRGKSVYPELVAMARDAERYRWLENNQPLRIREDGDCNTRIEWEGGSAVGRGLTETIDAAMKEQK